MVRSVCCVPGCPNNSSDNPDLDYHHLPLRAERRRKWLENMERLDLAEKSFNEVKGLKICGAHFAPDQYRSPLTKKLNIGAIPTIFVHEPEIPLSLPPTNPAGLQEKESKEISTIELPGTNQPFDLKKIMSTKMSNILALGESPDLEVPSAVNETIELPGTSQGLDLKKNISTMMSNILRTALGESPDLVAPSAVIAGEFLEFVEIPTTEPEILPVNRQGSIPIVPKLPASSRANVDAVLDEPAAPAFQNVAPLVALQHRQAGDLWDEWVQHNATESSSDEEGDDGVTLDDWRAEGEDIELDDSMPIQFRCPVCLSKLKRFVFGCGHSFCGECTERLYDRFRTSVCPECKTTIAVDPLRLQM